MFVKCIYCLLTINLNNNKLHNCSKLLELKINHKRKHQFVNSQYKKRLKCY